ncbi:MAG TPA: DUF362 domain-containing protein [Bacteroidota bacterium]|nr:DUF362 domain-containing protein [Bacteroidota bacterium]
MRFAFALLGIGSLVWMLIRIIPKPSRAQYPCMKVAAPVASGFVAYLVSLFVGVVTLKKARRYFRDARLFAGSVFTAVALAALLFAFLRTDTESDARPVGDSLFVPIDPPNSPMGTAKGIFPGRVVWARDSAAATWNGRSGDWWSDNNTHQLNVDSMFSKSIRALTEQPSDSLAWVALFKYFNERHGKGSVGYAPGEKIAVKINLNQISGSYDPGNSSFTAPQAVLTVLRGLVHRVGVADSDITVYDLIRYVPDAIYNKCKGEFPNVHIMGWTGGNGREKYVRDTTIVHWSEKLTVELGGGNPAHLPTSVTRAAYLINLASFKGHRYAGVTFCAKNHFGTLSCDDTTGAPALYAPHAAGVHPYIAVHNIIIPGSAEWTFYGRHMGTYNALVDLMGHKDLGAKTLLFMIEGLYPAQTEGDAISQNSRWLTSPFNNGWMSSVFLSQDNVAIESVALDFIRAEAAVNPHDTTVYGAVDNYLHEASQADNPPSGTYYSPNGDGIRLPSLGVHEHWNNSTDRMYSRNLGTGAGIELVRIQSSTTGVKEKEIASEFQVLTNYPNPFNPSTTIRFTTPQTGRVLLEVFDITGRKVSTLVDRVLVLGEHEVKFDARGLSSGVYLCRLETVGSVRSLKILLQK